MTAILDVPEIRARVHRWTVADYRALAEDNPAFRHSELIQGIIVEKEMKTPLHDFLTDGIAKFFGREVGPGRVVRKEASLLLADSVPAPDVAVVRGAREDFRMRHPTMAELVVEVAVTSLASDRQKAALYADAGVAEYWIVLAEQEQVEVYRRSEGGVYQQKRTYARGEVIAEVEVTGGEVAVETLFA